MAEAERVRCQIPYLRRSFQNDNIQLIVVHDKPIYAYIYGGDNTMYLLGFWANIDPDLIWNFITIKLKNSGARLVDLTGQSTIRRVRLEEKQEKCKKCRFALNGKPGGLGDKFKPVEEEK